MGRVVRLGIFSVVTLLALIASVRLIAPADTASSVRRQLVYLRSQLSSGAASRAQQDFSEGYFFLYALYGLTEVDLGLGSADRSSALREARWSLAHLESAAGRAPFAASLEPPDGIFYRGWVNWLRGGILLLQPASARDKAEVARFQQDSAAIGAAFDDSRRRSSPPIRDRCGRSTRWSRSPRWPSPTSCSRHGTAH